MVGEIGADFAGDALVLVGRERFEALRTTRTEIWNKVWQRAGQLLRGLQFGSFASGVRDDLFQRTFGHERPEQQQTAHERRQVDRFVGSGEFGD